LKGSPFTSIKADIVLSSSVKYYQNMTHN